MTADLVGSSPNRKLDLNVATPPHTTVEKIDPDAILFPAQCPETYSYTLTAAIASGLPIIATKIGSFPERLRAPFGQWRRCRG